MNTRRGEGWSARSLFIGWIPLRGTALGTRQEALLINALFLSHTHKCLFMSSLIWVLGESRNDAPILAGCNAAGGQRTW